MTTKPTPHLQSKIVDRAGAGQNGQGGVLGGLGWHGAKPSMRELARLRSALRRERTMGRAGHWAYSITRHMALAHQLKRAEAALARP